MNYKLRKSAFSDIRDIGRYSTEKFGNRQRDEYLLGLEETFKQITEQPCLSKVRDDISKGLLCRPYKQHLIFYKIGPSFVDILAILHRRMLPEKHIPES